MTAPVVPTQQDREALQQAWDGCDTLPPIIFTDAEADALISAIRLLKEPRP